MLMILHMDHSEGKELKASEPVKFPAESRLTLMPTSFPAAFKMTRGYREIIQNEELKQVNIIFLFHFFLASWIL